MSEAVQVALITASASVAVALLTTLGLAVPVLARISRRVKDVQAHVANDHKNADGTPINLRDDLDHKHDDNASKLDTIAQALLPIQRDIAWIMRELRTTDRRLDDVEDTITKGKTQ